MTIEGSNMVQAMLPIFIANDEDDDLEVTPSVAGAVEEMELPEVGDGHYLLFDATGRRGHLKIDRFDIAIERWDSAPDVSGVRSRIDRYLRFHSLVIDETLDDPDFVQEAARLIFDGNRKKNRLRWPGWLRKKIHGDQTLPNFPTAAD